MAEDDKEGLQNETSTGIKRIGDLRKKLSMLEARGIPSQHTEFEDLREEIHILLDHLILDEKIDLETSHLVRVKLRRIAELYVEMATEESTGDDGEEKMDSDKDRQDSKLHVVQLMLSQVYPKLKQAF